MKGILGFQLMPLSSNWDCVSPILAPSILSFVIGGEYLEVLKRVFCYGKIQQVNNKEVNVLEFLNASDLECQQGMFKLTMKSRASTLPLPLTQTF